MDTWRPLILHQPYDRRLSKKKSILPQSFFFAPILVFFSFHVIFTIVKFLKFVNFIILKVTQEIEHVQTRKNSQFCLLSCAFCMFDRICRMSWTFSYLIWFLLILTNLVQLNCDSVQNFPSNHTQYWPIRHVQGKIKHDQTTGN